MLVDEVVDGFLVEFDPQLRAHDAEQLAKLRFGRVRDFDLVRYAPEERFVDQVPRFEIGGEDDQLVEGHLDLLAVGQVEEVVAFFQRHDPAVEQFVGPHALPPEVVDDECPAVALQSAAVPR